MSNISEVNASLAGKKVINWEAALEASGGDKDFLLEILQDLVNEAETAKGEIEAALPAKNFDEIRKSAHKVKGGASYVNAEVIYELSKILQDEGHAGMENPTDAKLNFIKELFQVYCTALVNLKAEIANN